MNRRFDFLNPGASDGGVEAQPKVGLITENLSEREAFFDFEEVIRPPGGKEPEVLQYPESKIMTWYGWLRGRLELR